jgi:hypothetical protein
VFDRPLSLGRCRVVHAPPRAQAHSGTPATAAGADAGVLVGATAAASIPPVRRTSVVADERAAEAPVVGADGDEAGRDGTMVQLYAREILSICVLLFSAAAVGVLWVLQKGAPARRASSPKGNSKSAAPIAGSGGKQKPSAKKAAKTA